MCFRFSGIKVTDSIFIIKTFLLYLWPLPLSGSWDGSFMPPPPGTGVFHPSLPQLSQLSGLSCLVCLKNKSWLILSIAFLFSPLLYYCVFVIITFLFSLSLLFFCFLPPNFRFEYLSHSRVSFRYIKIKFMLQVLFSPDCDIDYFCCYSILNIL